MVHPKTADAARREFYSHRKSPTSKVSCNDVAALVAAAIRIHLNPVDERNALLGIAPGSHRLGRLPEMEITEVVERSNVELCLAARGDFWAYATPIVHSSRPADPPKRRRVLQVDYSRDELPAPLRWQGLE